MPPHQDLILMARGTRLARTYSLYSSTDLLQACLLRVARHSSRLRHFETNGRGSRIPDETVPLDAGRSRSEDISSDGRPRRASTLRASSPSIRLDFQASEHAL
jgi:hypothetical protein